MTPRTQQIPILLGFFKAADQFALTGDLSAVAATLESRLRGSDVPTRAHVEMALELPSSHVARKHVISACVLPYAIYLGRPSQVDDIALGKDLPALLESSDEFAAEVLRAFNKEAQGKINASKRKPHEFFNHLLAMSPTSRNLNLLGSHRLLKAKIFSHQVLHNLDSFYSIL